MYYRLIKSEPSTFSFDYLKGMPQRTDHWDGVRNYQARNFMRGMRNGDLVLFCHSSCRQPAVVGIAEVMREAYPDFTAWCRTSIHYDPASKPEAPRWFMVDVRWKQAFDRSVMLAAMKSEPYLRGMQLLKRDNLLSVISVTKEGFEVIVALCMKRRLPE